LTFDYTVVLYPDETGGFNVVVPALPGCLTCGGNLSEALYMAEDAILGYLGVILDDGEQIPAEHEPVMMEINEWHVGKWMLVTMVSVSIQAPRRQREEAP
jgi:predicted RNase H-like HicB family nuclease